MPAEINEWHIFRCCCWHSALYLWEDKERSHRLYFTRHLLLNGKLTTCEQQERKLKTRCFKKNNILQLYHWRQDLVDSLFIIHQKTVVVIGLLYSLFFERLLLTTLTFSGQHRPGLRSLGPTNAGHWVWANAYFLFNCFCVSLFMLRSQLPQTLFQDLHKVTQLLNSVSRPSRR